jgi:hypothetical protein
MKFPYPIGIELTGVPEVPYDNPIEMNGFMQINWDRGMRERNSVRRSLPKPWRSKAHIDMHCLEVPSPILNTYQQAKNFFQITRRAMLKNGLKPHHPDVVCGGGHIHVGVMDPVLKQHVYNDICRRPWLPWIFSQPDEEWSCNNRRNDGELACAWLKDYSVCLTGYNTIEFRFFEAALNWREQWDHIDFVLRYMRYMKTTLPIIYPPLQSFRNLTQQDCITAFRKLLGALGLPYNRYEKYVKRNLLPRWELGRRRR